MAPSKQARAIKVKVPRHNAQRLGLKLNAEVNKTAKADKVRVDTAQPHPDLAAAIESASDWNSMLLTARAERGPQWDVGTQQFLVDEYSELYYDPTPLVEVVKKQTEEENPPESTQQTQAPPLQASSSYGSGNPLPVHQLPQTPHHSQIHSRHQTPLRDRDFHASSIHPHHPQGSSHPLASGGGHPVGVSGEIGLGHPGMHHGMGTPGSVAGTPQRHPGNYSYPSTPSNMGAGGMGGMAMGGGMGMNMNAGGMGGGMNMGMGMNMNMRGTPGPFPGGVGGMGGAGGAGGAGNSPFAPIPPNQFYGNPMAGHDGSPMRMNMGGGGGNMGMVGGHGMMGGHPMNAGGSTPGMGMGVGGTGMQSIGMGMDVSPSIGRRMTGEFPMH
ncbi:hypothetical protein BDN72DRAFT_832595 [Pluteus cervinus]|uniref:Uncharacterized protein n=1 Tax=Pluteus cervinus TaxID=181527 RepID=A0ACD3BC57_9AGAR|nr:hypothetical protein BDN72DRAFT_832595 [Pluteus cervinus]